MFDFVVSKEEITRWTADMVAIPSYPGIPNQEEAVAEYIKSVFDAEGVECRIDRLEDGRVNVIATLKGIGGGHSLMLNGHMDTVPPYDMEDACVPRIEGDLMHGRGASDMKGELAAAMAALISLKRQGAQLSGDLIFTGVADEEEGSLGCIRLIQSGLRADGCIVCEGLGLGKIAVFQKGLEWYQVDFIGKTVHGGAFRQGVNAIEKAARFVTAVEDRLKPALEQRTAAFGSESTVNIAVIHGGTQPSTIAGECRILLDRRFLPVGETYESTTAELQRILDDMAGRDPDFHAELSVYAPSRMKDGYVHQGFITDENDPLVMTLREAMGTVGIQPEIIASPCWTDGGLIGYYARIPVVVCGPGGLSIAHSKEEAVSLEELRICAELYQRTAERFCR